jgi:hypothetical protein
VSPPGDKCSRDRAVPNMFFGRLKRPMLFTGSVCVLCCAQLCCAATATVRRCICHRLCAAKQLTATAGINSVCPVGFAIS